MVGPFHSLVAGTKKDMTNMVFVLGGPAYIPPIRASAVVGPMLSLLSMTDSSATTVLATLRTLNTIADASALSQLEAKNRDKGLFHSLYNDEVLATIVRLLSQSSRPYLGQQQICLAAALIAKTCRDDSQRNLLVQTGVLDALALILATFVDATGCALRISRDSCSSPEPPDIASPSAQSRLAPILGAIGAIIDTSRSKALHFLSNPALTAVLLRIEADVAVPYEKKPNTRSHPGSTSVTSRPSSSRHLESLLPQIPSVIPKGTLPEPKFHPPFGAVGSSVRLPYSARALQQAHEIIHGQAGDSPQEDEHPLVAWLIYVVRACSGLTRLLAAWLISLLHESELVNKRRDVSFAMLLVPLLVRLLEKDSMSSKEDQLAYDDNPMRPTHLTSQQQAPSILATLMVDSPGSQRAAVDAGGIKKLAKLLKESYKPISKDLHLSQWTAEPLLENGSDGSNETVFMDDPASSASVIQVAKVREAVLTALASLASTKDEYRKTIIENGVVPFVIESLKPYHSLPTGGDSDIKVEANRQGPSPQIENPSGVILAACAATRSLSRSVTTLRTSLMDAGVAAPLFVLLKHHDVNVQVAATTVISNLVLEFSPMREVSSSTTAQHG